MPRLPDDYVFQPPRVVSVRVGDFQPVRNPQTQKAAEVFNSNQQHQDGWVQGNLQFDEVVRTLKRLEQDLVMYLTEIATVVNGLAVIEPGLGGKWLLGVSYFGALSGPDDVIRGDIIQLAFDGFVGMRVFAIWDGHGDVSIPLTEASAVDPNGNLIPAGVEKLKYVLGLAEQAQMTVNVTLQPTKFTGLDAHVAAVKNLLTELKEWKAWNADLANECDGIYTSSDVARLYEAARQADETRLIGASLGTIGATEVVTRYTQDHEAGAPWDLWFPHNLSADFGDTTGEATREIIDGLAVNGIGRPLIWNELTRVGNPPDNEPTPDDFYNALIGAKQEGARGGWFHTAAGHDLREQSFFEQLTEVEAEVELNIAQKVAEGS